MAPYRRKAPGLRARSAGSTETAVTAATNAPGYARRSSSARAFSCSAPSDGVVSHSYVDDAAAYVLAAAAAVAAAPSRAPRTVARSQPAAVDHEAVEIVSLGVAAELDGAAGLGDRGMQPRQHAARLDMTLVRIEQARAEAALERRLQRANALGVQPSVTGGESGKALEIGAVARMRHHQRAVERRFREMSPPQIERADAESGDHRLGGLLLAPRRQHSAGPMACGFRHPGVTALVQGDGTSGLCEQQRMPGAGYACADDGDGGIPPRS